MLLLQQNKIIMEDKENIKRGVKVVHVHFISSRKNYYFSSVRSVYKMFNEKDIGCSERVLRRELNKDGAHYINKNVMVIRNRLLT